MKKTTRSYGRRRLASSKATHQPAGKAAFDHICRPVEEVLVELAGEVPQAEWDKLPGDLTDNLDHYLYGTPKR